MKETTPRLTAVQFERFMDSGRTAPALCGCEDQADRLVGEYVVKLRGSIQDAGLLKELLASRLARHFGIATPEPAVVTIESALAELVAGSEPDHAVRIRGSVGLNFGTRALRGVSTWPVDKTIPEAMWQQAVDIFAFDALIQNPDRRYQNPNLFARGDTLVVFDHETAFSFLLDIFPSPSPWKLSDQRYLIDHVFYRRLKTMPIDLSRFEAGLRGLSDGLLGKIVVDVPAEWNNNGVAQIDRHLRTMRDHAGEFADEIRRFLA